MTTLYLSSYLASTYGSGAYDRSNYNGTNATGTGSGTGTTGGTGSSGALSNTGVLLGLIVGIAAALLLAAMVVRIWRRPSRQTIAVEIEEESVMPDTLNR